MKQTCSYADPMLKNKGSIEFNGLSLTLRGLVYQQLAQYHMCDPVWASGIEPE